MLGQLILAVFLRVLRVEEGGIEGVGWIRFLDCELDKGYRRGLLLWELLYKNQFLFIYRNITLPRRRQTRLTPLPPPIIQAIHSHSFLLQRQLQLMHGNKLFHLDNR